MARPDEMGFHRVCEASLDQWAALMQ